MTTLKLAAAFAELILRFNAQIQRDNVMHNSQRRRRVWRENVATVSSRFRHLVKDSVHRRHLVTDFGRCRHLVTDFVRRRHLVTDFDRCRHLVIDFWRLWNSGAVTSQ